MIKFFEDHQSKKRKAIDLSHKIKASQEVNALLDKDYKNTITGRKRNSDLKKADSKRSDDKPDEQNIARKDSANGAAAPELAKPPIKGIVPEKVSTADKSKRGVSINSVSTKGQSVLSGITPGSGLFGARKPVIKSKITTSGQQGASLKR